MKIPLNLCRNYQKTDIRVVKFCRDFMAFDFRIQRRWKYSAVGLCPLIIGYLTIEMKHILCKKIEV